MNDSTTSRNGTLANRLCRLLAGAGALTLAAACGDEGSEAGTGGTSSEAPGGTAGNGASAGSPATPDGSIGSCEGVAVPGFPEEGFFTLLQYHGDVRLLSGAPNELQEQSLLDGALTPLFEITADPFSYLAIEVDDTHILAESADDFYLYERASGELASFASTPEEGEIPGLPMALTVTGMELTDTRVYSLVYAQEDYDIGRQRAERSYLVSYDRATGEMISALVSGPIEFPELEAHDGRLFRIQTYDAAPEAGMPQLDHSEVATFDLETGDTEVFLESEVGFGDPLDGGPAYAFWRDYFVAIIVPRGETERQLVRVPLDGGAPEVLLDDLSERSLAVEGDKAYVALPVEAGTSRNQLTEVDLVNGETRPMGDCDGKPLHVSESSLYVYDTNGGLLRLEL